MKWFIFWTLALYSQFSFGQSADSLTQITFRYNKGHYLFGQSGHYATSEIIEYAPDDKVFRMLRHMQIKKFYDSTLGKTYADTTSMSVGNPRVSQAVINSLLQELNTSRENYTSSFLKPYLIPPSKKQVLSVAATYDLKWMLEKENSDRSERRALFSEVKHLSQLDSFLQRVKPAQHSDLVISTDSWNMLSITCSYGNDTTEYRSDFFELPAQPIIRYDNRNYMTFKQTINLQANNAIRSIVPQSSLIYSVVDLNELTPKYIKWYMENNF